MLIGYARVSTTDQETTLQLDALQRAGARTIHQEKKSSVGERPALEKLIETLEPGDIVLVYKIDRFARSLADLLRILDAIEKRESSFKSLTEPIDTQSLAGRMMMQMLGAFAEFERGMIRERSMAGQRAAKERGVSIGRPRSLTPQKESEALSMYQTHAFTLDEIAMHLEAHSSSVKRAIYRVVKPGHSSLR